MGDIMSLISLTFGEKKQSFSTDLISISTPLDRMEVDPNEANSVKVKKVCQFFGDSDLYLVCKVVSGAITEQMIGKCEGKSLEIKKIDSKYPRSKIAKKGMTVGLSVSGVQKSDVNKDYIINFAISQ